MIPYINNKIKSKFNGCVHKRKYKTKEQALKDQKFHSWLLNQPGKVYPCPFCKSFHISYKHF